MSVNRDDDKDSDYFIREAESAPPIKELINSVKQIPEQMKDIKTGRGRQTSPEVTAAVINCLLTGQFNTDVEIAHHIGISPNTVGRIKKLMPIDLKTLVDNTNDRGARIDTLVFEFLEEGFESLKRISRLTNNNEWLQKQTAVELATLYGIKADRNIKLLQVIDQATKAEESEELVSGNEE